MLRKKTNHPKNQQQNHKKNKEKQKKNTKNTHDYFYQENGEEPGLLAAERFLNFVAFELGPAFYNLGVQDAKKLIHAQVESLDTELSILEKPLNPPKRK